MMVKLMMVVDDCLPLDYGFSWINVHSHSNCICWMKRVDDKIRVKKGRKKEEIGCC